MYLPKSSKGFTLLELLIAVSIISILSAGIIPSFSSYIRNQNLKQAQEWVKSDLRSVQNRALTGALSNTIIGGLAIEYWGITFTGGTEPYSYFISVYNNACPPNPASSSLQGTGVLTSGIVYSGGSGDKDCIFFSRKNGDISTFSWTTANAVNIKYVGDTAFRTVNFNPSGLIFSTSQP